MSIRIKKSTFDQFYLNKTVSYTTLIPTLYARVRTGSGWKFISDGFNFDAPGRSEVAGGAFFLDRESAYRLVHPDDRHILDELQKSVELK